MLADLFPSRICVLDTETTGVFGRDWWARVVELGAVILDRDGSRLDTWSRLVMPDVLDEELAREALAVNHLRAEDIRRLGQPTRMAAADFMAWLRGHNVTWCTSFNAGFDRRGMEQMGVTRIRWASCVMLRATEVMGAAGAAEERARPRPGDRYKWVKLSAAVQHFGVTVEGDPHRALADALAAADVAIAIRRADLARAA